MRLARRSLLLVTMAVVAVAFAAPSAFGQLELMNESTEQHCGVVLPENHEASGDCEINLHSEDSIDIPPMFGDGVLLMAGGIIISACEMEFELYPSEDGSGLITHQVFQDIPGLGDSCIIGPCQEQGGGVEPWPIQWTEPAPGLDDVLVLFCMSTNGSEGLACELKVAVQRMGHQFLFTVEDDLCHPNGPAEMTGEWLSEELETNTEVEHP